MKRRDELPKKVPESFSYRLLTEVYPQDLCVTTPVELKSGHCIYISREAIQLLGARSQKSAVRKINAKFNLQTIGLSTFPTANEFEKRMVSTIKSQSDLYVCHGSRSQGSGRSVLHGGFQLKGVGRTELAGCHEFYKDSCGAEGILDAFLEVTYSNVLDRILSSGAIRCDFITTLGKRPQRFLIFPERAESQSVRCILGRRGSPLRKTHLDYLLAKAAAQGRNFDYWHDLSSRLVFERLKPNRSRKNSQLKTKMQKILWRALVLVAESRLYGLRLCYWGDNHDVYCRVFDTADTRCEYPQVSTQTRLPAPRDLSPHDYFSFLSLGISDSTYDFSLYPIKNSILTIDLILRQSGWDCKSIDKFITWKELERLYARALQLIASKLTEPYRSKLSPQAYQRKRRKFLIDLKLSLPLVPNERGQASPEDFDIERALEQSFGSRKRATLVTQYLNLIGYGTTNRFREALEKKFWLEFVIPLEQSLSVKPWNESDLLKILSEARLASD